MYRLHCADLCGEGEITKHNHRSLIHTEREKGRCRQLRNRREKKLTFPSLNTLHAGFPLLSLHTCRANANSQSTWSADDTPSLESIQRGVCGAGGRWQADADEAYSGNVSRAFSPKKRTTERACTWQRAQPWCRDLLEEKLVSLWTGGVEGRKGPCPTKKERRERSHRSGERC